MPNSARMIVGDRARRLLAAGEQLEDAAPDRVAEDVERVHGAKCISCTYISAPAPDGQPRIQANW